MTKQRLITAACAAALPWIPAHALQSAPPEPAAVAARLEKVLEKCTNESDFPTRRAMIAPVVQETMDGSAIAREFLGERSDGFDEAQRADVAAATLELVSAGFAARFEGAAGSRFESLAQEELGPDRALVAANFPSDRGAPRRVEFRLARGDAGWRIVGVQDALGGVSEELRDAFAAGAELDAEALAASLRARAARLAESPGEVVARLQRTLIDAMQRASELGYAGRRELLAPVVADTHDFEALAKLVVSDAWRELDTKQREELVETFRELAVATYAARFDSYAGQRFGPPVEREAARGAVLVKSLFHKADGGEAHFDYLMRRADGRWRILNIVVDGVSDLALQRTEYGDLIASKGFPALVAKLREKIARSAAGGKD